MILDEIIDSTDNVRDVSSKLTNKIGIGVPIGNYLSQYFANLYLSELDHLCKEELIAKYYGKYVRIIQVINYAKYFRINFIRNSKAYYADSRDKTLFYSIHRLNHFPINFKITKYDWRIYTKNRKENIKPQT